MTLYPVNYKYNILFLLTNLPYFIISIKFNYILIIAIISSLHHSSSLFLYNEKEREKILFLDLWFSNMLFIYLIINSNLLDLIYHFHNCILFLLSIFYKNKNNIKIYYIMHGLWHISSAITIFLLLNKINN